MSSKWEFRQLKGSYLGGYGLFYLSPEQRERVPQYEQALETATASQVANPTMSNYFVRESVVAEEAIPGGNIEYGFCSALHGEECIVAAFRSRRKRRVERFCVGIVAGNPGNIANPCGNCRDIMRDDLGVDFEIVCGAPDGGIAVVANMHQFLFEEFGLSPEDAIFVTDANDRPFVEQVLRAVRKGKKLENDAYSREDVLPERRYYACVATKNANYYGALDVMCEYHPIYPLRDAVRQARRAGDPHVRHVIVVTKDQSEDGSGGIPPHVMYKDRQHLLELNIQSELTSGAELDPPVFLATYNYWLGKLRLGRVWRTSVKEWLPFPFSPKNFGPEFLEHLSEYYKGKTR